MFKRPFWGWVFCEADGTPSFARVATAVILAFICGWVTALVRWNHTLPALGEATVFLTILYGTNKVSSALKKD